MVKFLIGVGIGTVISFALLYTLVPVVSHESWECTDCRIVNHKPECHDMIKHKEHE